MIMLVQHLLQGSSTKGCNGPASCVAVGSFWGGMQEFMGRSYPANRAGKVGDGLCVTFCYIHVPMIV